MANSLCEIFLVPVAFVGVLTGSAFAQCGNRISPVPLHSTKTASHADDFVRFRYALAGSDSLEIRSHGDTETPMGSYDTGFSITRNGASLQTTSLRKLAVLKQEDDDYANSFRTMAVTQACGRQGATFFVTMQYIGDMTSPALLFLLIPTDKGYSVSTLPMISGGVLEVSKSDPFHLRTWDNLHEGMCEACHTRYEVTEYEVRDAKPVRVRRYRTRHQYTDGNYRFNELRIRFVR